MRGVVVESLIAHQAHFRILMAHHEWHLTLVLRPLDAIVPVLTREKNPVHDPDANETSIEKRMWRAVKRVSRKTKCVPIGYRLHADNPSPRRRNYGIINLAQFV
jgi:hypothetical protein